MDAVLTLAGEGTRMLPWTRGLRKEFLPLYDRGDRGEPVLKPVAHFVVESLARSGARRLTVVVQPKDLAFVRHYFSIDPGFLARHRHHAERLAETERFYATLRELRISFAVQPRPDGFGDAVLRARPFTGSRTFLVHAGDAVLLEPHPGTLPRAMARLLERDALDAVLLVRRVADPRRYGVVEGAAAPRVGGRRRLTVTGMVEKPDRPKTHWAATAVYAFAPSLYPALERYRRRLRPRELELTDGIRELLAAGGRVAALVLERPEEWRSVGSPDGFARALARTRHLARRRCARRE